MCATIDAPWDGANGGGGTIRHNAPRQHNGRGIGNTGSEDAAEAPWIGGIRRTQRATPPVRRWDEVGGIECGLVPELHLSFGVQENLRGEHLTKVVSCLKVSNLKDSCSWAARFQGSHNKLSIAEGITNVAFRKERTQDPRIDRES